MNQMSTATRKLTEPYSIRDSISNTAGKKLPKPMPVTMHSATQTDR